MLDQTSLIVKPGVQVVASLGGLRRSTLNLIDPRKVYEVEEYCELNYAAIGLGDDGMPNGSSS